MRLYFVIGIVTVVAGLATAQETNFPAGPQYLITGSPLLLQPISTPSLNLGAPPASTIAEGSSESQVVPAPAAPQAEANLPRIYWGEPTTGESANENVSEIEFTPSQPIPGLPKSLDVGVAEITDPQSLASRGFGMTLAEAAAFWKARRTHTPHVYTNDDLARLHGG